jgi:hypothetical protein
MQLIQKSLIFAGLALVAALALVQTTSAQTPTPLKTVRIINGLAGPVYLTSPPGDTSRLFILEQHVSNVGRIRILNIPSNTLNATPYLSVSPVATGNEVG